ncbi:MAG: electron transfer flavoprotein subunit alpha/FixB family protein [Eubacteriales bacterium]|nr:electron transfer flavoprotein subunit alpha/FixB family protein [Eubacteriales bacterium]
MIFQQTAFFEGIFGKNNLQSVDCFKFFSHNGELVTIIPAFGGKLLGEILIPEKRPAMATVKPGVFSRYEISEAENVQMIDADTTFLNEYKSKITLVSIQKEEEQSDNIETAEVVICAGLGISSEENWEKAKALARILKGKLGYTRPTVDMGYAEDESAMIGTSGKMIHPKLYIGFGVSGATHHVCGMKDSKTIISINTDENAAIFDVSDYKLVGDCGMILDDLLKVLDKENAVRT